jgi:DNA polymerase-3 subunit gamma/tau
MPSYVPLARKYRPQTFEELIGQPHVTTTLARAIESQRVGQAYLFVGQRGVGKTSAARILAKCLTCAKGPTAKPCQQCPRCAQITAGSSLDVIEIDGASNRGIDEIRSLREAVKFAPTQGPYRIYIIDEVHQVTDPAFNALLKTLEEPPAHVKFIFATTAAHKVPATILSRCQRFDFRRLDGKTIASALQRITEAEGIAISQEALYAIARSAEGSLRDAEVILEQLVSFCAGAIGESDVSRLLGVIEQDALLALTQALLDHDANAALQLLTTQLDQGKEVTQVVVSLLRHLRHLLILRTIEDPPAARQPATSPRKPAAASQQGAPSRQALLEQLIDVPSEQLPRLEEQAKRSNPEELLLMGQLLTGAYELCRRSPFAQAVVEFALIKLATRESWASLEQVIQRLDRLAQAGTKPPAEARVAPAASESGVPRTTPAGSGIESSASSRQSLATVVVPSAAPGGAGISLDVVTERWPEVLERLGRQKMSLAAYLTDAKPLGVLGSQIQLGIPAFALHQEVLNLAEHMRLVERVLGEVFAQPLGVLYTTLPESSPAETTPQESPQPAATLAPEAPTAPMPPIVKDIVHLFDATIVQPPPPLR